MKHGLLIQIGGAAKPKPKRPEKKEAVAPPSTEEEKPSKQTKKDIGFLSDSQYCGNCGNNKDDTCSLIGEEVSYSDTCLFGWCEKDEGDEPEEEEEEEEEEDAD